MEVIVAQESDDLTIDIASSLLGFSSGAVKSLRAKVGEKPKGDGGHDGGYDGGYDGGHDDGGDDGYPKGPPT